jgi:tetratricopeptide (TPR) repeat protein
LPGPEATQAPPPRPAPRQPAKQPAKQRIAKPVAPAAPHQTGPVPPSASLPKAAPAAPSVLSAAEYQTRGRKFIQEEKYPESIEPLTRAVKLDPSLSQAFNARGYAYLRMNRYKEAIADFNQAIKLNPLYTNAYVNRGLARRAAGNTQGADADQAKVRELMKMK